jgi:hypothetical protein
MTPTALSGLSAPVRAALERARSEELLDAADLRLIDLLDSRAGGADADALALVTAALCHACAGGSLCLPLDGKEFGGILRNFSSAVSCTTGLQRRSPAGCG